MTNPDFTIADVLAWARTKPARRRYDYNSNNGCVIAQFLIGTGRSKNPMVGGNGDWDDHGGVEHIAPAPVNDAARARPFTFGGFVQRLEQVSA